ncbi:hypothetical protein HXX76_010487 [Chlamydomonas incerta]|uniref:Uncharacterized protein n=1 Tax=Chlamydomonas incerta TaxID=51695 RepID=A0A835SMK0_CHLIN|nr:hypothetical protein HXX76_010487 [Chlamydomonas incerta]|eukprot:KAG2428341.1 hypothetical protein HXX76_010487 [Chlamydomonas incerta]
MARARKAVWQPAMSRPVLLVLALSVVMCAAVGSTVAPTVNDTPTPLLPSLSSDTSSGLVPAPLLSTNETLSADVRRHHRRHLQSCQDLTSYGGKAVCSTCCATWKNQGKCDGAGSTVLGGGNVKTVVCPKTCGACATTPTPSGGGAGAVLASGTSALGTYYYDVRTKCPQDVAYSENNGYPSCASWNQATGAQLTMKQLNTNNIIAIGQLTGNPSPATRTKWCGKKVVISVNGQTITAPDGGDWFVWDGCLQCSREGNNKLDFSVSGLTKINKAACTLGVVKGITYQILDVQIKKFVA